MDVPFDIFEHTSLIAALKAWKKDNEHPSHRALAALCGRGEKNAGFFANLLAGRLRFTPDLTPIFIQLLGLDEEGARYFRALVSLDEHQRAALLAKEALEEARGGANSRSGRQRLSAAQAHAAATTEAARVVEGEIAAAQARHRAQSHQAAALDAARTLLGALLLEWRRIPGYRPEVDWITQRLAIPGSAEEIQQALARLEHLPVQRLYETPAEVERDQVHAYYSQVYAALGCSLADLYARDDAHLQTHFGGVTLCLQTKDLTAAREILGEAQRRLADLGGREIGEADARVYQAFLTIVPLTVVVTPE